ncbi:MAG: hypothetical protein NTV80_07335 [Verrucomicrobia bacterium]|nr:hypothetical protein [Verrucomicrobiota bacterium]
MKRSEKILLTVFGFVFLIIVGGGMLAFGIQNYRSIQDESASLAKRITEMKAAIAEGSEWQRRSQWLDESVPSFTSRQDASSKLLDMIQKEADKNSLTLAGKEFIEEVKQLAPDGLPVEEEGGYFDQASVKITITGTKEQPLFGWMHALQQPSAFLGITRLQLTPSGQGKTVNVEVEITQFYREKAAAKITKADIGGRL